VVSGLNEAIGVTLRIARVLERLGVPYLIGGSMASSFYGEPRSTNDVDVVADLQAEHVSTFIADLRDEFYLDETAIREAVSRRSTFNLVHLGTMFKVDIFVAKNDGPTAQELERRRPYALPQMPGEEIIVASPEDIIVQKLYWYRLGDHVSERQWGDAMSVLKVRRKKLDLAYMRGLAEQMGVADLLARALGETGLPDR
jgi:hypothetical protein